MEPIAELSKALSKAQGEFPAAPLNSVGQYNNKFADLGSIISTIKPILAKNGLSFAQLLQGEPGYIEIKTILLHISGERLESIIKFPLNSEARRPLIQEAGIIITYLRRYSLSSMLGIYTGDDTDGNTIEPKQEPKQETKQETKQEPKNTTNYKELWPKDAKLSYELASKVVDRNGTPYVDIPISKLPFMYNSVVESIKEPDNKSKANELMMKRDTLSTLIEINNTVNK